MNIYCTILDSYLCILCFICSSFSCHSQSMKHIGNCPCNNMARMLYVSTINSAIIGTYASLRTDGDDGDMQPSNYMAKKLHWYRALPIVSHMWSLFYKMRASACVVAMYKNIKIAMPMLYKIKLKRTEMLVFIFVNVLPIQRESSNSRSRNFYIV